MISHDPFLKSGLRCALAICALTCFVAAVPSQAQDTGARALAPEQTASGAAYEAAMRFRGVDVDVTYFDPNGPVPNLETRATPERPVDLDVGVEAVEPIVWVVRGLIFALVIGVIYVAVRFGGRFSVALRSDVKNPARSGGGPEVPSAHARALPGSLREILAMGDRNAALIALAQAALAQAMRMHDMFAQPSWTSRDALRRLPGQDPHRDALRRLVMTSERVQFGGRSVSEEDFEAHVAAVTPLLNGAAP